MIASWMSYAFLVGALLAITASVLERINSTRRWPMRVVWAVALFLSIGWPVGSAVREIVAARMQPVTVLPFTITVQPARIVSDQPLAPDLVALVDRLLVGLWICMSLVLLVRLVRGVMTVQRSRRDWALGEIDGTPVRLSDNVGPAVVGLHPMDVVVPEWILTMDAPLRALVLRHEEEHRAARDPYLLFLAAIGIVLMPWNIPLWIQARRLRLAIEMDCDARVLKAHPTPERYGLLMLTIAQRRATAPTLFAPMLSEPTTQLERRILAMRTTSRRLGRLTIYGGAVLAVALVAFACSLTSDNPIVPSGADVSMHATANASPKAGEEPAHLLSGSLSPRYPAMLRSANVEGSVVAQFVVDTNGAIDPTTFKARKSSHDLFTAAVRSDLSALAFSPAIVSGKRVKQLVEMTFSFNLSQDAASASRVHTPVGNGARVGTVRGRALPVGAPRVVTDSQTYYEYQVEQQVTPDPRNAPPRYPMMLRSANVEGDVLAQFVVDTSGHADMSTFQVLKSSHALFTNAVTAALPNMRFFPAKVGGKHVKQLVQMPFQFNLSTPNKPGQGTSGG
ncbi:MAG TPA: TonB family protein [Gemmatimonadaceae bacterium]|jgi:TonB family protein